MNESRHHLSHNWAHCITIRYRILMGLSINFKTIFTDVTASIEATPNREWWDVEDVPHGYDGYAQTYYTYEGGTVEVEPDWQLEIPWVTWLLGPFISATICEWVADKFITPLEYNLRNHLEDNHADFDWANRGY